MPRASCADGNHRQRGTGSPQRCQKVFHDMTSSRNDRQGTAGGEAKRPVRHEHTLFSNRRRPTGHDDLLCAMLFARSSRISGQHRVLYDGLINQITPFSRHFFHRRTTMRSRASASSSSRRLWTLVIFPPEVWKLNGDHSITYTSLSSQSPSLAWVIAKSKRAARPSPPSRTNVFNSPEAVCIYALCWTRSFCGRVELGRKQLESADITRSGNFFD